MSFSELNKPTFDRFVSWGKNRNIGKTKMKRATTLML
jgi:hypothetical protein